jgi:uncharacterized protein YbbC (DUF1343 family)
VETLVLGLIVLGCTPQPVPAPTPLRLAVRPGIEVLLGDSIHLVRGHRVGLVANHAAVDANGTSDVERLLQAGVKLVALFSPEHGFRGAAAPGEAVASTVDSATGLPIYSLYGRTSAPTDSMLAGIDAMLVDLPDVGARYFTYLHTTIEVMKAAGRGGRPVLVLDRPNPIGGTVQGNMLNPAHRSAVGALAMPMRHGLTLGELAQLARLDLDLRTELRVVPVSGWRREAALDETGLPFLAPSPNLKDLESLFHYPGTCLFEATALSVGRGTDLPFSQIGAPWLDVARVIAAVPATARAGVRLTPVEFTPARPGDGKYDGVALRGIRLTVTDRRVYDPTHTAVALLVAIQTVHPDSVGIRAGGFDRLAGGPALREAIQAGGDPAAIVTGWSSALSGWREHRTTILLYP